MFAILTLLAHTSHEAIEKLSAMDNFYETIDKSLMIEGLLGMLLTTESEEERDHN